ncbi:MAG: YfhL family 4Fe-4S dicluster ferredoxin [Candidatus Methylomirabilales bacterium]
MALFINEECSSCGACESECPNQAISEGDSTYVINADLCTECVGFSAEPACKGVCPTDSIGEHPEKKETRDELLAKFKRLHPDKEPVLN